MMGNQRPPGKRSGHGPSPAALRKRRPEKYTPNPNDDVGGRVKRSHPCGEPAPTAVGVTTSRRRLRTLRSDGVSFTASSPSLFSAGKDQPSEAPHLDKVICVQYKGAKRRKSTDCAVNSPCCNPRPQVFNDASQRTRHRAETLAP